MPEDGTGGGLLRNVPKDRLSRKDIQLPAETLKEFSRELSNREPPQSTGPGGILDDKVASKQDIKTLCTQLKTVYKDRENGPVQGLTSAAAATVLARDGKNELEQQPVPTFLELFLLQLVNFVIELLFAAAAASIIVTITGPDRGNPLAYTTGVCILILIFINAGIAAKTESAANGALDALKKMAVADIECVRNGKAERIAVPDLVRGDIVNLLVGDVCPADCRLIEGADFKVNEMPLTGEPDDVAKTHKLKPIKPGEVEKILPETMCFSSCAVTNGKATCVIVNTGMNTRIGKIAKLLQDKQSAEGSDSKGGCLPQSEPGKKCFCCKDTSGNQTPLQKSVASLGATIGFLAIGVCVFVFILGVVMQTQPPRCPCDGSPIVNSIMYMILISVTLAVAAIPEGIPLCVTISLSLGCKAMCEQKVQVRQLAAVETLGSASVICTDKTGTLTEGKMTLKQMWSAFKQFDVSGQGFNPEVGTITLKEGGDGTKDVGVRSSLFAGILCCNTLIVKDPESKEWKPEGNSSEAPIVVAAQKIGFKRTEVDQANKRHFECPFSSARKMMLTVTHVPGKTLGEGGIEIPEDGHYVVVCKGAPNFILDACAGYLNKDGEFEEMTADVKRACLDAVDAYSSKALRVLAIATRFMKNIPESWSDEEMSTDDKFKEAREGIQLLGLVASIDPERNGVPQAVIDARGASIRVVMITGDYLKTAIAIAHNCNILQECDDDLRDAVDCGKLRPNGEYLCKEDMDAITLRTKVFARAQPEDKLEIVKSLQRQGFVSAMTGDGVNDAPALKRADIGVAMNIQGTEVAKGAAEMILLDDDFANIVKAVEKGRIIYAGIQKFVAFIMSVHIAEVLQILFCVVAQVPLMRNPLQILFLILVTDLPPSIALGVEPGEPGILKEKPRPKNENIVLGWMWLSIFMNGLILATVIIGIYMVSLYQFFGHWVFNKDIPDIKARLGTEAWNHRLMQAQTVAFIALVFSENIRAYISRSFNRPFWTKLCKNVAMQKAIALADIALIVAVFCPVISKDILQLDGTIIGWQGWVGTLLGPILTLILCELYKIITHYQIKHYNNKKSRNASKSSSDQLTDIVASVTNDKKKLEDQLAAEKAKVKQLEGQIAEMGKQKSAPTIRQSISAARLPSTKAISSAANTKPVGMPATNGMTSAAGCLPCIVFGQPQGQE